MRFREWVGAGEADEFCSVQTDGAVWSRDWLTRQLVELATAEGDGGCCGAGTYLLDRRDHWTEWVASSSTLGVVLTLAQDQASNAVWAVFGALTNTLAARLRESHRDAVLEDDLDEERIRAADKQHLTLIKSISLINNI